ncbi:hypothetical protein CJP74_07295 [Psittacicella melopsittaci]|uniref:Uncharacterized protein n=1 Tax=Psittacicella melopsittaci TaxID=2028576 RepID=A0A3A1Y1Z7_9GAMM|nr:hypothetical protein [Psittacicella melopsittaci]RIY31440.1 hypothetical protein CJP74_07295 [Psittacicella melopsittaci]
MLIIISLVIIILIVLALVALYFKKLKPVKDEFKGTSLQAVYTITTQFADRSFLDASFIEIYTKAITSNYDLPESVLTDHIANIKKCIQDRNLAYSIIRESLANATPTERAHVLAKAISLTVQIEGRTNLFSKQLKIPGSKTLQSYKEVLAILHLTNQDVKQALEQLNATTDKEVAQTTSDAHS